MLATPGHCLPRIILVAYLVDADWSESQICRNTILIGIVSHNEIVSAICGRIARRPMTILVLKQELMADFMKNCDLLKKRQRWRSATGLVTNGFQVDERPGRSGQEWFNCNTELQSSFRLFRVRTSILFQKTLKCRSRRSPANRRPRAATASGCPTA